MIFDNDLRCEQAAAILCGVEGACITPVTGGGNSSVYRLVATNGTYALKQYKIESDCLRNRQLTESRALAFLAGHGIDRIPRYHGSYENFSLFSWIDGHSLGAPEASDLPQVVRFFEQLQSCSFYADADDIPKAFAASVSLDVLIQELEERYIQLEVALCHDSELHIFMTDDLRMELTAATRRAHLLYREAGLSAQEIAKSEWRIVHGDFGAHNMIKDDQDRVHVLDFEYFGWDDPARMVADFALHPGVSLSAQARADFLDMIYDRFAERTGLLLRLDALLPLFAVRWALIVLNIFLPSRWTSYAAMRGGRVWNEAKERQVLKARFLLTLCRREGLM